MARITARTTPRARRIMSAAVTKLALKNFANGDSPAKAFKKAAKKHLRVQFAARAQQTCGTLAEQPPPVPMTQPEEHTVKYGGDNEEDI